MICLGGPAALAPVPAAMIPVGPGSLQGRGQLAYGVGRLALDERGHFTGNGKSRVASAEQKMLGSRT